MRNALEIGSRLLRSGILYLALGSATEATLAQDDAASTNEALKSIAAFAHELCVRPDPDSSNKVVEVSGGADIKLDNIISKIVGLGINGAAKYRNEQARGVLQKDLAGSYKDANECALHVLDTLASRLIPTTQDDPSATKMAGRWNVVDDPNVFVNVNIKGRSFHSVTYGAAGVPTESIDGEVVNGNVDGDWFIEPLSNWVREGGAKKYFPAERGLLGRVQMRLSSDERRLLGTLTVTNRLTGKKLAQKVEWSRP
jgi:hypothetical protein